MSEHMWVQESLPLYVTGGLNADERGRLVRHVGQCHECSRALDDLNALGQQMTDLFAEVRPVPDLGEAMVQRLRQVETMPLKTPWRRPSARAFKVLAICASVVIVMVIGGVLSETILDPRRDQSERRAEVKSNQPPQEGQEGRGPVVGLAPDGLMPHFGDIVDTRARGKSERQAPDETRGRMGEMARLDKSFLFQVSPTDPSLTKLQDNKEWNNRNGDDRRTLLQTMDSSKKKVEKSIEEYEKVAGEMAHKGKEGKSDQPYMQEAGGKMTAPSVPGGVTPSYGYFPGGSGTGMGGGGFGGYGMGGLGMGPAGNPVPTSPPVMPVAPQMVPTPTIAPGPIAAPTPPIPEAKSAPIEPKMPVAEMPSKNMPADPKARYIPFPEIAKAQTKDAEGDAKDKGRLGKEVGDFENKPGDNKAGQGQEGTTKEDAKGPDKGERSKGNETTTPGTAATTPAATSLQRRIIRTGTIEFEIDSFDVGVATLTKLVIETQGAFVNTVNSEKRPNGKVAGSVVVRMPPEQLDEFVLKLRRDLGKFGELKMQQISSQDITKQYTDLESQLKAARTMEERLISIIKEGKGVIKDLLQAEKELGVWRTKIEEFEGTLRYYANQASLSTLTIMLIEKELRQAVSILETERVQAGIEVEDVEAAHKSAIEAVNEMKGRIVKTELKKHPGGQFNAVLDFEIAPEQSGPMRDRLKQIGVVARLDVDRVQRSEGGTPARDTKVKRGDSQFFVNLYNLANVAARETVQIRVAANDVPKAYQAVRDQIAKAKAHVRDTNLNEQDRDVSAKIDVDVHRPDDIAVLKAMTDAGEVLYRQLHRRSDETGVTDAKVHINLQIVNAVNIPARETITLRVAVADVAKAFGELRDKIQKTKARVISSQMQEQDRLNVSGDFQLDVIRPDDGAMLDLLVGAGEVLSRHVNRRADVANVTDTKVQFNLTLVSSTNIAARENVTLRIAVTDVPKAFQQAREDIAKAKARIVSQVQEQDRQNEVAVIDFDIARPEHAEILKQLSGGGEVINRHVQRLPDNPNLTDTKVMIRLELWNVAKVPARDTLFVQIAAIDVAKVFQTLRDEIVKAKANIQVDKLSENDRRNVHASLEFNVQRPENERVLKLLLESGDVMNKQAQRRPDSEGALDSKVHFKVTLVNALTQPARKRMVLQVAALDVDKAYGQVLDELNKAKSFIDYDNSRKETGHENSRAYLAFSVRRPEDVRLLSVLNDLGEVLSSKDEPNVGGENSTDANVAFSVELVSAATIQPRETVTMKVEVENVGEKLEQIGTAVKAAKGRIYNPTIDHSRDDNKTTAVVTYDIPLGSLREILAKVQAAGKTTGQKSTQDPKAPDGKLALARIQVTMSTRDPLVGPDDGFKSGISSGLSTSIKGLALSLRFLIVGLLFVVPWLLLLYGGYILMRRYVLSSKPETTSPTAPSAAGGE